MVQKTRCSVLACFACACLLTWSACAADEPSVRVEHDGRPFATSHTSAEVGEVEAERWLSITATSEGTSAMDDEVWFTATLAFDPDALKPGRFKIAGSSDLAFTGGGYPLHTGLVFSAGADHDQGVLRAWVWHHFWFSSWEGAQHQEIAGTLVIEELNGDHVRGQIELEAKGGLVPGSPGPDHTLKMKGTFRDVP